MNRDSLSWRRLDGAFGAEIAGVAVDGVNPSALLELVHDQQLLVIRDQRFDPAGLERFAATLGELDVYPFAEPLPGTPHVVAVVKNPDDIANFGGAWHSDTSYLARPPALTLLYAVEVPAGRGDTLFADMCAAFAALSPTLRGLLEGLQGHNTAALVHAAGGAYANVAGQGAPLGTAADMAAATHPVVRRHPATGRSALYLSLVHTERFAAMTREESLPLIEFLQHFAVRPERITRLRWRPGTLAIWDNRSVQHYPLNDYAGKRREMHRVILRGERPLGVRPAPGTA